MSDQGQVRSFKVKMGNEENVYSLKCIKTIIPETEPGLQRQGSPGLLVNNLSPVWLGH